MVRAALIDRLGRAPAIRSEARYWRTLERLAATSPDVQTALLALDTLRAHRLTELRGLLAQRLALARQSKDDAAWRPLALEDERWFSLVNGSMLPGFLREPPAVFSVAEEDKAVRVLMLGDFGFGAAENRQLAGEGQTQVAAAMLRFHRLIPHDFGLTLGDNFYPDGMPGLTDPRWRTLWHGLYDALGIKFYATLGNHDWHAADSAATQILYSRQNESWRLPAPYYSFSAGPAQFFALDTTAFSEAQARWLKEGLLRSRARWKIAYGHHPIYSHGRHGGTQRLIQRLLPILKAGADAYFAGHEHDMQHLKPEAGLHFFINGVGGAPIRTTQYGVRSLFALRAYGFVSLAVDVERLDVKFIGTEGQTLYQYSLTKPDESHTDSKAAKEGIELRTLRPSGGCRSDSRLGEAPRC